MTKLSLLFIFLTLTTNIFSQDQIPDLITDRSDKTESVSVIPSVSFQIESGFEYMKDITSAGIEINSFSIASTLFRYGLFVNLELRLGGKFFI